MSRTSAFGCVPRTVLMSGSSTGFMVAPRCAPSRASRRRTPTPGAASVAWPRTVPLPEPRAVRAGLAGAVLAGAVLAGACLACEAIALPSGGSELPLSARGSGTPAATAASAGSASWVDVSAGAAMAAFVPVVITSPATRAPHIRPAISVLGRVKRLMACVRFPGPGRLDGQEGTDREVGELGPAVQEGQLEQHGEAGHLRAGAPHQIGRGPGGAPGGQDVVDDQDAIGRFEGVGKHLDGRGAVFELVVLRERGAGQLALLADRHEARAEAAGHRGGEDEAARLDARHLVYRPVDRSQGADHRAERRSVGEQRGDVLEDHTVLRVVGDVTYQGRDELGQLVAGLIGHPLTPLLLAGRAVPR